MIDITCSDCLFDIRRLSLGYFIFLLLSSLRYLYYITFLFSMNIDIVER
jgi:hypothetical protein